MKQTGIDIFPEDVFSNIKKIADNSIDLIITSPPYNIGKSYEIKTPLETYLAQYEALATQLFTKIKDTGSLCWQVGNFIHQSEVFPLDIFFYRIFKSAGFKLRNRIIWHFDHGLHASKRLSGRYETILWFSKTDNYTFNLDNIRIPSKYPGKLNYKGEKKGLPSGNPLGKNPSDFWTIIEQDWDREIWNIVNVKSNHPEKTSHPCQFPIELTQRCILALTNPSETVLDPFMGVGSTAIGAIIHERNFIGFDTNEEYINIAKQRIQDYQNGNLKIRPLTKQIYQPTGKEKVSQVPLEWTQ